MRSGALALALAALAAVGCASTPPVLPPPPVCSPLTLEPVELYPQPPELTASQRLALYQGVLGALPVALAQAWLRFHEVEVPGYARRQAARVQEEVDRAAELCVSRGG